MRSLLIIDHTLRSYDGHSYNYDVALARVGKSVYDRVDIYADKRFKPNTGANIFPVLRSHSARSVGLAKRWLACLGELASYKVVVSGTERTESEESCRPPSLLFRTQRYLRAIETVRSWESLVVSDRYSDASNLDVFVQHACMAELLATELFAKRRKYLDKIVTVHLVIRHSPERTCSSFEPLDALKYRIECLVSLQNPIVRLYTDSELLREAFVRLASLPDQFKVLPIPVDVMVPPVQQSKERVRLGFLGSPRMEKGFGLIPYMIEGLPPIIANRPIELAVQTLSDSEEPEVRRITKWLRALVPRPERLPVVIWRGPVTSEIYYEWFSSTDILLALYTSPKYIASTSGVFAEALHCGVPTITFSRTWVSDQIRAAAENGLRIGEPIDTVQQLPEKVEKIVRELDRYRQDTLTYLGNWRQFHTPEGIVAVLHNRDGKFSGGSQKHLQT